MVWKKKLRSSQYTFNSERVFLVATQPGKSIYSCLQTTKAWINTGRSAGATIRLWKKQSGA